MLKRFIAILMVFVCGDLSAQSIEGAWRWEGENDQGEKIVAAVIFMDGFQVATWYNEENPEFITTNGGKYSFEDGLLVEVVEFHSDRPETVGDTARLELEFKDTNTLYFKESGMTLKRLDDGTPGVLAGPWLFSGRKRNGEVQERDTSMPRKTMKILSGTRFQWIAYNTDTGQFSDTGGGTYTTKDGKYTENIEFFSRDNSRVGASLGFDFELQDGKWHHSGNNSRGEPMYEFWSFRTK
ncbi:MAG: membrane or secreted protein [Saprospiraceae bacterium]|nr:membrane or secreted protein [Saprospiraceae bacterium]